MPSEKLSEDFTHTNLWSEKKKKSLEQGTLQSGKLYFQSIPHLTDLFKSGKTRVIWEGQDSPCKLSLLCLKLQFHWACKVKKGQMVNKKFVSF